MSKKTDTRRRALLRRRRLQRKCPALVRIRDERRASEIAKVLRLSRSAVSMWERVPAKHVIAISEMLRISRHRIRPDLYRGKS
jgi:transcriptional regulator with XRE-family HTH domain